MGQARLKAIRAGEVVKVDFAAPDVFINKTDRVALTRDAEGVVDETRVIPRAMRIAINNGITAAFPQGAARHDRKVWAAWQEALADEGDDQVEMTRGDVEWVLKNLTKDGLLLPLSLSSWVESVIDYLDGLLATPDAPVA
jgi:hypothetical protein